MAKTLTTRVTSLERSMSANDETHDAILVEIKGLKLWIGNGVTDKIAKEAGKILSSKLGEVEKSVEFIKGKIDGHVGTVPSRKTIVLRKVLETGVTALVLGGLFIGGVLLFTGRLEIDDVINILKAWKG